MIQIPLTRGKFAIVDDIFTHLKKYKWYFLNAGTGYAAKHIRLDGINKKQSVVLLHHCVIGKPFKGFHVDHFDGNGLNNSLENLRIVTARVNHQNQSIHRDGWLPGTYFSNKPNLSKRWGACAHIAGKNKYIGAFLTQEEAHMAYKDFLIRNGVMI